MIDGIRYGWTHPICDNDWFDRNDRDPLRVPLHDYHEAEICAYCGALTRSGIYVRADPSKLRFPALDDDL